MPKQRGFHVGGIPNPLLQQRPPQQPTGPSIRDIFNRPRPTLDEVKKIVADKEKKNAAFEALEEQQSHNFREELTKYRTEMFKRQAKKEKKQKELEKRKKRKHSSGLRLRRRRIQR